MNVPTSALGWNRYRQAVGLIVRGRTARVAAPVAAVVGSLLCGINQGAALLGGSMTGAGWARIGANYVVPYCVSSYGYLGAFRIREQSGG